MLKRWWCREPGAFYPINVYAKTEREARAKFRKFLNVRRLPKGTEVYQ